MSQDYLQYSMKIPDITPEEAAWFEALSEHIQKYWDEEDPEAEETWRERGEKKFGPAIAYIAENDNPPDNSYDLIGESLYVIAEENGDAEFEALVLEEFIDRFRPNAIFVLSYAYTCSKMVADAFGGGAVVISREETKWFDAQTMAYDRVREIQGDNKEVQNGA